MAEKEEFQESELIFSDSGSHRYGTLDEEADDNTEKSNSTVHRSCKNNTEKKKKKAASSLPVNISRCRHCCTVIDHGDDSEEEGGEMVAPHVILERRIGGEMAFSVCSGNGRTLKGRDLSQVRNSVLRMTGFLEP